MSIHNKTRPQIILFDGVSGVGKSMFLNFLKELYEGILFVGKKTTNRKRRESDNDWEFEFIEYISPKYELLFSSVGNLYAINKNEIEEAIANNFIYVISCTDKLTIQKIKNQYRTIVIYIYRNFSSKEFSDLILEKDSNGNKTIEKRMSEFSNISLAYIENLDIYDHVILNISSVENALMQIITILSINGIKKEDKND